MGWLRRRYLWGLVLAVMIVALIAPRIDSFTASPIAAAGAASVLTQHNDNNRSGGILNETMLTTANVNVTQFGLLGRLPVDGQEYAQPLYVPGVTIAGSSHNVVYVATMHNTVYAFDADDFSHSTPLWSTNLGPSVPASDLGTTFHDIANEVGILSTPVIDQNTGTLYAVSFTKEIVGAATTYIYRLHALDVTTGAEMFGGPVVISATVPGSGPDSKNGVVKFRAIKHLQRPALLLANGTVYLGFAGHGEQEPYHGWLLGYNAGTLAQTFVFNASPDSQAAGFWQGGQGPAIDADGNIYLISGNGQFNINTGGSNYGDSFIKVNPSGAVADYFTPSNQLTLNNSDLDLGIAGPLLIPGTSFIVGGGKQGKLYVVDSGNMSKFNPSGDTVHQEFQVTPGTNRHIGGSPVYWNGPSAQRVYLWGDSDHLKAFKFANGLLGTTPDSQSSVTGLGDASVEMSISANGSTTGSGILWAVQPTSGTNNTQERTGILRAFDASDVSKQLWNSDQNAARDAVGSRAKFVAPTIANGKVYLATFSGNVDVYGLLPTASTPTSTPSTLTPTATLAIVSPTATLATASPTNTPSSGGILFSDNFEADPVGVAPANWTATGGAWPVTLDQSLVVKQTASVSTAGELTAGNPGWTDYTVSVDVKAPGGTAPFGILGRWQSFNYTYLLLLRGGTTWQLAKRVNGTFSQIRAGTFSVVTGTWYTLKLSFSGTTISASIGNTTLATVKDTSLASGQVGFHTLTTPEYDNVVVTSP